VEQQRRRRAIRVVYHPVVVFQRITAVYHHFSQLLRIIINVLVLQNTIKQQYPPTTRAIVDQPLQKKKFSNRSSCTPPRCRTSPPK
jgi:hypothetical protein